MVRTSTRRSCYFWAVLICLWAIPATPTWAADPAAKVYVVLWFDTEDYILPASDDAALRVADFLSQEKIRATFKVVGEKARTLERRGRTDVIAALKKHEIGYHSNYHSVQPTPAQYLANLGWEEGVAEFERREGPGRADVERVFGTAPTCYGQPGSSWGPQVYGAMRNWGMEVYLDVGTHVRLEDRPFYYGGLLNLYKLAHTLRANLGGPKDLEEAEGKFLAARQRLGTDGGGIISIYYHPCEFVHKEFWDGVNFRNGANPPREQWRLPPTKTAEESKTAYQVLEGYVRFMKRFADVQFITASEAAKLYRDKARGRQFNRAEMEAIAKAVDENISFQRHGEYTLAASEVFSLLNEYVVEECNGRSPLPLELKTTPYGPSAPGPVLTEPLRVDASQFTRTAVDVADHLRQHGRIPSRIWLGSVAVPPEAYLRALARATLMGLHGKPILSSGAVLDIQPAKLAAASYVADDGPNLWGWVIFPRGFRAPALMELAKRQAWTLKPALLDRPTN